MPRPYIPERQVEYWTSRQIEDYYLNAGFECITYPLTQRVEEHIPADFVFQAGAFAKMFGLQIQYKALYPGLGDHWELDATQHAQLARFGWIYYGLSGLKQRGEFRNALHALRVKDPAFAFSSTLASSASSPYMRWWAFDGWLQDCRAGVRVYGKADLQRHFGPVLDSPLARGEAEELIDVFVVNYGARRVAHFAPQLRGNFLDAPETPDNGSDIQA